MPNGVVWYNDTGLGGVAHVSCDHCYKLMGAESLHCLDSGEWDAAVPTCEGKDWNIHSLSAYT